MPDWIGYVASAIGSSAATWGGLRLTSRRDKTTAEQSLIDQLQEELARYRKATDARLDKLERENQQYRRYVFELIDHGRAHGVEPLPWPADLPR